MSYRQRLEAEKQAEETKSQWNYSVASKDSRRLTAEDRMAAKIAQEVLKDNQKLRGIHSGASIQKILQKEAKKHLMEGGSAGPNIVTINEKGEKDGMDPSNLPYLHRNPAI